MSNDGFGSRRRAVAGLVAVGAKRGNDHHLLGANPTPQTVDDLPPAVMK